MTLRIRWVHILVGIFFFCIVEIRCDRTTKSKLSFSPNGSFRYRSLHLATTATSEPLHTKLIRDWGVQLVVGSKPTGTLKDIFPDMSDTTSSDIECVELALCTERNSDYKTRVRRRFNRNYYAYKTDIISEVDVSSHFVQVGCQIWDCEPKENLFEGRVSPLHKFKKIVNQLVEVSQKGRFIIGEIKHYSGVEVFEYDCWKAEPCVEILETKCIARSSEDELITFKCGKNWDEIPSRYLPAIPFGIRRLIPVIHGSRKTSDYQTFRISDKGPTYKIGSPLPNGETKKYECQPASLQFGLFPPKIYLIIEMPDKQERHAELSREAFNEAFLIAQKSVQICELIPDRNHKIYRVTGLIIGKINVKDVRCGSTINQLISVESPYNSSVRTIRYNDETYYDAFTREPVDFKVEYIKTEEWRLASYYDTFDSKGTDIFFLLPQGTIFSTWISSIGYDLIVGSATRGVLEESGVFQCAEDTYLKEYETNIQVELYGGYKFYTQITDDGQILPNYSYQKAWYCFNSNNEREDVIRVVNKFRIEIPVHNIKTFDGVEIVMLPSMEIIGYCLDIFEVKYLTTSGLPVKIGGVFKFQTYGDMHSSFSISESYFAMRKNEIVPNRNTEIPLEREINLLENHVFKKDLKFSINSSASSVMDLNTENLVPKHRRSLYICDRINTKEHIPIQCYIRDKDGVIEKKCSKTEEHTNENEQYDYIYFENYKQEKFKCTEVTESNGMGDSQLYRATTDLQFGSDFFADINRIEHNSLDKVCYQMQSEGRYELQMKSTRFYEETSRKIHSHDLYAIFKLEREDMPIEDRKLESGTMFIKELQYKAENSLVALSANDKHSIFADRWNVFKPELDKHESLHIGLVVGTVYKGIIGSKEIMPCIKNDKMNIISDSELSTKEYFYKGEMKNDKTEYVSDTVVQNIEFNVWECTHPETRKNILRILNRSLLDKSIMDIVGVGKMLYSDAITITYSEKLNKFELIEVKFLDKTNDKTVKYEGEYNLDGNKAPEFMLPVKLGSDFSVISNRYSLKEGEVLKTIISTEKGLILEVGELIKTTMHAKLECTQEMDTVIPEPMLTPKIRKLKKGIEQHVPVVMEKSEYLDQIFTIRHRCKILGQTDDPENIVYRIFSSIELKKSIKVHHIYHYDEVTVQKIPDKIGLRYVTYIKTKNLNGDGAKRIYTPIKLDGLINFKTTGLDDYKYLMTPCVYPFETRTLHAVNVAEPSGPTIDISSEFDKYIYAEVAKETIGEDGEEIEFVGILKCVQDKSKPSEIEPLFSTKFTVLEENTPPESPRNIFNFKTQELWTCMSNIKMEPGTKITRVVNKMFTRILNPRIYHHSGVEVGILSMPDKSKLVQITEEKFFEVKGTKINYIDYYGKVKLLINPMIGTKQFFHPHHTIFEVPRTNRTSQKMLELDQLTLDGMRIFAAGKYLDEKLKSSLFQPRMSGSNSMKVHFVHETGSRMYQLGRPSTKTLYSEQENFKCFPILQDNREYNRIIFPRIGQYVGDKLYTLSDSEVEELAEITSQKIFLCTNRAEEFLKVDLEYNIKEKHVFALRYYDTVQKVEHSKSSSQTHKKEQSLLKIFETFYMDVIGQNVIQYEGHLKVIEPSTTGSSSKNQDGSKKGLSRISSSFRKKKNK